MLVLQPTQASIMHWSFFLRYHHLPITGGCEKHLTLPFRERWADHVLHRSMQLSYFELYKKWGKIWWVHRVINWNCVLVSFKDNSLLSGQHVSSSIQRQLATLNLCDIQHSKKWKQSFWCLHSHDIKGSQNDWPFIMADPCSLEQRQWLSLPTQSWRWNEHVVYRINGSDLCYSTHSSSKRFYFFSLFCAQPLGIVLPEENLGLHSTIGEIICTGIVLWGNGFQDFSLKQAISILTMGCGQSNFTITCHFLLNISQMLRLNLFSQWYCLGRQHHL